MPISSSRERLTLAHERSASSNDIEPDTQDKKKQTSSANSTRPKETTSNTRKPRKVKLPSIDKLKLENKPRSLSHDSAAVHNRSGKPKQQHIVKPKSIHHYPHQGHHSGHHHRHKKRKSKKEKEGDDIVLRKIRFFSSRPEPAPLTLCLSYPGVDLSHRELLDAITSTGTIDKEDVKSIQFVDMNCILGTAGVDNRWLVTLKDFETRYLLLRDCIWIDNDPLHFRLLDDVNMEDYKEYQRRMATLESDEHVSALERLLALHGQNF